MKITVDIGAALRKTAALKKVSQAAKKQLKRWGANSVKAAMRAAAALQKTNRPGSKHGSLARSVDMVMDGRTLTVGTNLRRKTSSEKYAKIQDEGGTIKAKKKYLTIPLPGTQGRAADYKSVGAFFLKSKSGNLLLVAPTWGRSGKRAGYRGSGYQRTGGLRALFLLKPEVHLPATRWFSGTMMRMESLLPGYMDERVILDEAAKMAGVGSI